MQLEANVPQLDEGISGRFGLRPDLVGARLLAEGLSHLVPHLAKIDAPRFDRPILEKVGAWCEAAQMSLPEHAGPIPGIQRLKGDWPVHAMIVELGRTGGPARKLVILAAQLVVASDLIQQQIDKHETKNRSGFISTRRIACRLQRRMTRRVRDIFPDVPYYMIPFHRALEDLLDSGLADEYEEVIRLMERTFAYALGLRDSPRRGPRNTKAATFTQAPGRAVRQLGTQDPDGDIQETEFALFLESAGTHEEIDVQRRIGLSGEESELGVTLLQPKRDLQCASGEAPALATWRTRNAVKHQQKATQRLPSRWDGLSSFELITVLQALDENRELDREAVAVLALCLMTGQPADDALRTRVYRDVGALPTILDPNTVYLVAKNATWHRAICRPTDARPRPADADRILEPAASKVGFPIAKRFWRALEPSLAQVFKRPDQSHGRLFRGDALTVIEQAKILLSRINKRQNTRLTLLRIQQTLFQLLVEHEGDVAEAFLVTGQLPPMGQSASIFYHHTSSRVLIQRYTEAVRTLPLEMEFFPHDRLRHQGSNIGSELTLSIPALRTLVADLLESVGLARINWTNTEAWIEFHNAYTNYNIMLMLFTTGYRAVQDPIADEADVDWQGRLVVINDKSGEREGHSRIVPLAQPCWQQLKQYQRHRRFVIDRLSMLGEKLPRSFFFYLTNAVQVEQVRPATLEKRLKHCFRLPLNINRHLLRGYIRETGVPGEAVDAFMGHWMDGQNPWGRYSSLDPLSYRAAIGRAVERLSHVLDWRVLEGLA